MRFTGFTLWVQENKLSEKFYKKLGFEITHSTERDSTASLSGIDVFLINLRDEAEFSRDVFANNKGRGVYINIAVEDVDLKYRELIKTEVQPYSEPRDWEWGRREFIVKDPDGYKLCFWQSI